MLKVKYFSRRDCRRFAVIAFLLLGLATWLAAALPPAFGPDLRPVVLIDPGHGGYDPGITIGDLQEKNFSLAVARCLRGYLTDAGYRVVLTRNHDTGLAAPGGSLPQRRMRDLELRAAAAARSSPTLLLTLHTGSHLSATATGPQIFYPEGSLPSRSLATALASELAHLWPGSAATGPFYAPYYLLEAVAAPAVAVELGFLSNPTDRMLLRDTRFQEEIAQAIVRGINAAEGSAPALAPDILPSPALPTEIAADESANRDIYTLYFAGHEPNPASLTASRRLLPQTMEVTQMTTGDRQTAFLTRLATGLVDELILGPTSESGLWPTFPAGARLNSLVLDGDTVRLDLDGNITAVWDDNRYNELTLINSLVRTLRELPGIKSVELTIEGDAAVTLGGHLTLNRSYP